MAFVSMCFGKKEPDEGAKKNAEIEKALREDKKRQEREVKILLLGEWRLRQCYTRDFLTRCRRSR